MVGFGGSHFGGHTHGLVPNCEDTRGDVLTCHELADTQDSKSRVSIGQGSLQRS
jgi:hypothetical protein